MSRRNSELLTASIDRGEPFARPGDPFEPVYPPVSYHLKPVSTRQRGRIDPIVSDFQTDIFRKRATSARSRLVDSRATTDRIPSLREPDARRDSAPGGRPIRSVSNGPPSEPSMTSRRAASSGRTYRTAGGAVRTVGVGSSFHSELDTRLRSDARRRAETSSRSPDSTPRPIGDCGFRPRDSERGRSIEEDPA